MLRNLLGAAVIGLAACATAHAQDTPVAFVGATLIVIDGPDIANGAIVLQDGRISAVGDAASIVIPEGAIVIDATGKTIMPGLVDTHSHIGGPGGADSSSPIQPDVRVMDAINPMEPGFRRAAAGGVTTMNIMPGSGHLLSGQTIYVKNRGGKVVEDIQIYDADGGRMWGVKMANGTNSIRNPPFPGTRGKSAALVRAKYVAAQEYRDKIIAADGDPEKMPKRDLGLEALVEVLDGKRIVHHHTHRADDIMTVIRLSQEFGFRVVLHHTSEGWKVADEIAAAGVPVSAIIVDSPGGKLEAMEMSFETGKMLEDAGANVAFHTDDMITDSRLFFRSAALATRAGMSRDAALRALTLSGAEMLDLDDRVGSLTAGKDADILILSGDPLSVYTKVLETWVEGIKVFDYSDEDDYLYAVGGFGAGDPIKPYLCCIDEEMSR